jgi:hypothetical protein
MTKKLKRRCRRGSDDSQKTSVLRVSTHWWGNVTSVAVLVEHTNMSRTKCFFRVRISLVLRFIANCDPFTESPFLATRICVSVSFSINLYFLFFSNNKTLSEKQCFHVCKVKFPFS